MIVNAFLLSLRAIERNILRSFLTILGVVIGVAAVVTMVTLGNGATRMVSDQITSLGSNLLLVFPNHAGGTGSVGGGAVLFKSGDADMLAQQIGGIRWAAPVVNTRATLVAGNKNWNSSVVGSTQDYAAISNWRIAVGRNFASREVEAGLSVCLIGDTVRRELFGAHGNVLGDTLRVGKITCQIIGVLAAKGQSAMGQNPDDSVVLPIKTVQRRMLGNSLVQHIMISMQDRAQAARVVGQIKTILREQRKVPEDEDDNFNVVDTIEIAQAVSGSVQALTMLLGLIAAVSLLVGGIGIMNIMLVSVTERTREIGIRLAIGALEREVLLQFLIESMVLSTMGGVAGLALALLASWGLSSLLNMPFTFDVRINVTAFLFSAGIGVLFGIMPAKRAASLDPIQALRHE